LPDAEQEASCKNNETLVGEVFLFLRFWRVASVRGEARKGRREIRGGERLVEEGIMMG